MQNAPFKCFVTQDNQKDERTQTTEARPIVFNFPIHPTTHVHQLIISVLFSIHLRFSTVILSALYSDDRKAMFSWSDVSHLTVDTFHSINYYSSRLCQRQKTAQKTLHRRSRKHLIILQSSFYQFVITRLCKVGQENGIKIGFEDEEKTDFKAEIMCVETFLPFTIAQRFF